jgi:L-fuconolactonase
MRESVSTFGGRVDAHLHQWRWADLQTRWRPPLALARDFLPSHHAPLARRSGVVASVVVEAGSSDEELRLVTHGLAEEGQVVGSVAALDLTDDDVISRIERLMASPYVCAARMNVEAHPDRDVLLRPGVKTALAAVAEAGLGWEFLVVAEQLPHVRQLLDACPTLHATIEHLGKPRLEDEVDLSVWRDAMAGLAADSGVLCKLSYGFRSDALQELAKPGAGWPISGLQPVTDWLLRCFGTGRLMWGSDWPLSSLLGTYEEGLQMWQRLLGSLGDVDLERIFSLNAATFYGFSSIDLPSAATASLNRTPGLP